MNSRSPKGTPTRRRKVEGDRRRSGVVSATGSGIISEFGNQGSDSNRPDRVAPAMSREARRRADTRPRPGAADPRDARAARDRDAWEKGADPDAIGGSRIGTRGKKTARGAATKAGAGKKKRRIAEMRSRSRGGDSGEEKPGTGLLGNVARAGGEALRRAGRLGAPVGIGFRALRGAARAGALLARGVSDAWRERAVEPHEEEKRETDVRAPRTLAAEVATDATRREHAGAKPRSAAKRPDRAPRPDRGGRDVSGAGAAVSRNARKEGRGVSTTERDADVAARPKRAEQGEGKKGRRVVEAVVVGGSAETSLDAAAKGATKKYSANPTGSFNARKGRRSTRRRATKNAGSRRR